VNALSSMISENEGLTKPSAILAAGDSLADTRDTATTD
jgi:hypothetical protein